MALQFDAVHEALTAANGRPAILSAALGLAALVAKAIGDVFHITPETVLTRRLGDPDHFSKAFGELVSHLEPERLVIAIDNLDRCTPDVALELLGTIKAYLEPKAAEISDRHVVFVIAVDDHALRRHLLSKELEDDSNSSQAQPYVDEYLRKVFNTTVRVAPLVPDDIRGYIGERLDALQPTLRLLEAERKQVIGLAHSALRTNPRRIIQFLNNFALRLELIRRREIGSPDTPAAIVSKLSANPAAVAKVVLIEDQWPDFYRVIRHHPQRLAEWQQAIQAGDGELAEGPSTPADLGGFIAFLRFSADIEIPHLRAQLTLKQSKEEAQLPNYAAFREAATTGARETVQGILDADPDQVTAYADAAADIFDLELYDGWMAGARSVLDVFINVPALAGCPEPRVRMMRRVQHASALHVELRELAMEPLLAATEGLSSAGAKPFFRAAISVLTGPNLGAALLAGDALAKRVDGLTTDLHEELKHMLLPATPLTEVERLALVATLVAADKTLMGSGVARAAMNHLANQPVLWHDERGRPLIDLLIHAIDQEVEPDISDQILDQLPSEVPLADPEADVIASVEQLRRVADAAWPQATEAHRRRALGQLAEWFTRLWPEHRLSMAEWLWPLAAPRPTVEGDSDYLPVLLNNILIDVPGVAGWLASRQDDLAARLPDSADAVANAAASRHVDREGLLGLAKQLDPSGYRSRLAGVISTDIVSGRLTAETAVRLIEDNDLFSDEQAASQLAANAAGVAQQQPDTAQAVAWIELALSVPDPEQPVAQAALDVLATRAQVPAISAEEAARIISATATAQDLFAGSAATVDSIAQALIEHQRDWLEDAEWTSLLDAAGRVASRLTSGQRRFFWSLELSRLANRTTDLATAFRGIIGMLADSDDTQQFARHAVDLERGLHKLSVGSRSDLLRLVSQLAASSDALAERLEELKANSDPADRQVLKTLNP